MGQCLLLIWGTSWTLLLVPIHSTNIYWASWVLDTRHTKWRYRCDPGLKEDAFQEGQSSMRANKPRGYSGKAALGEDRHRAYLSLGGGECQKKLRTVSALVKRKLKIIKPFKSRNLLESGSAKPGVVRRATLSGAPQRLSPRRGRSGESADWLQHKPVGCFWLVVLSILISQHWGTYLQA